MTLEFERTVVQLAAHVADLVAVDRHDDIVHFESGAFGGGVGDNLHDADTGVQILGVDAQPPLGSAGGG